MGSRIQMDKINRSVFPLAALGSIHYFQSLLQSQGFLFEQFEHFPKQTIRNRYEIKSANGRTRLTIPVIKPSGSKTNTKDILISDKENWQQVHWRSLIGAYSAAPYFEHYKSDIEQLIFSKEKYLVDFNLKIIEFFSDTWDLQILPELTTEYHHLYENDFRNNEFDKSELDNNTSYIQVLFEKSDKFVSNLSLIDLLFCEGPIGRKILIK